MFSSNLISFDFKHDATCLHVSILKIIKPGILDVFEVRLSRFYFSNFLSQSYQLVTDTGTDLPNNEIYKLTLNFKKLN